MKLPDAWSRATPVFDDEHLVSCAGLAPVMALAEQTGLSELIGEKVALRSTTVKSAGVNPAGKLTAIIAGMAAGADSIDDLQVVRSGGMKQLFAWVYAPATLGQFLREFSHGHTRQLGSVARAHLVIAAIPEHAWTPVHYPGAVLDPDTGELISDAEVAETRFTAFASTRHPVTARLVVRRVRDQTPTRSPAPPPPSTARRPRGRSASLAHIRGRRPEPR